MNTFVKILDAIVDGMICAVLVIVILCVSGHMVVQLHTDDHVFVKETVQVDPLHAVYDQNYRNEIANHNYTFDGIVIK